MSSALAAASLILKPEGYSEGTLESLKPIDRSGDFTFTRGSNLSATRINSAGLIEKGRENLLLQSNQFDTTWLTANTSLTGGQSGYDGSSDAWLLDIVSGTNSQRIEQSISQSGVQTYSVYVKKGTLNWVRIRVNATVTAQSYFDLENGVVGTIQAGLISRSIESVGNGWFRCSIVFNSTSSLVRIYPANDDGSVTQSSGSIYIQDAQLEAGLAATDYIETGASTVKAGILENTPRLDYSGGATEPSLLLEPQRTNQCSQSEYIGSSDWAGSGNTRDIIVTQTSEINPEGAAICWKIQGTSTDNQLANNSSTTSGTTITNSIYVKRVSGTGNVILRDVNNSQTSFSLSVADGWKRIDATGTATSVTARFYLNLVDYTDEILVWGAQQEEGSYPTSYIPTYGSSETRSAEENTTANISSVISQNEGTFFLDFEYTGFELGEAYNWIALESENGNERVMIYKNANSTDLLVYLSANSSMVFVKGIAAIAANTRYKIAFRYNTGNQAIYLNGIQKHTSTHSYTRGSDLSRLRFNESDNPASCRVHQCIVFESGLTDSKLATLTTL